MFLVLVFNFFLYNTSRIRFIILCFASLASTSQLHLAPFELSYRWNTEQFDDKVNELQTITCKENALCGNLFPLKDSFKLKGLISKVASHRLMHFIAKIVPYSNRNNFKSSVKFCI